MVSSLERRRFGRLIVPLVVRYQAQCPKTGQLHEGQAIIRDLSPEGAFFHLDHHRPWQPGQILSLTISAPLPLPGIEPLSHLSAQGEVVRLEPPRPDNPNFGVAVSFLGNLSFAALDPSVILT